MLLDIFLNFLFSIIFLFFGQDLVYNLPLISLSTPPTEISLSADKAAVFSDYHRTFIYEKNIDEKQAIASITKLMTAMVFIDTKPNWQEIYQIKAEDKVEGGRINLFLGDELNLKDLLYTSLIASDNGATIALTRAANLSEKEFVTLMNQKALALDLKNTSFSDPVGLNENNISTAREVVLLLKAALEYPEIKEAISLPEYRYQTVLGREKVIESTDSYLLTEEFPELKALGGKTGYINESGYCFVGLFKDENDNFFIASVLNSASRNSRFLETYNLVNWYQQDLWK